MKTPKDVVLNNALDGKEAANPWLAIVDDKMALIRAVAEGRIPAAVLEVDKVLMHWLVNTFKSELNYPGISTYKTTEWPVATPEQVREIRRSE